MKIACTKRLITVVTMLVFFTVISCKKNNDDGPGSNNPDGSISATTDGAGFQSSKIHSADKISNGLITINGLHIKNGDTISFTLCFPDSVTLNVPMVFNASSSFVLYSDSRNLYSPEGYNGEYPTATITVTSLNTVSRQVSGTFTGALYDHLGDALNVANGRFSAIYHQE
jgi:Family of unknown function (DUF6252)